MIEQRLIWASDIDKTLTGDNLALRMLGAAVRLRQQNRDLSQLLHGRVSGRSKQSIREIETEQHAAGAPLPRTDFEIGSVGEYIAIRNAQAKLVPLPDWPRPAMVAGWNRTKIIDIMRKTAEVRHDQVVVQGDDAQGNYKYSYELSETFAASLNDHGEAYRLSLADKLAKAGVAAQVILSGEFLDFMAPGINKGSALRATLEVFGAEEEDAYTSGDSNNDRGLNLGNVILVGNAAADFRAWAEETIPPSWLYVAEQSYAAGVHEGLVHYGVLG